MRKYWIFFLLFKKWRSWSLASVVMKVLPRVTATFSSSAFIGNLVCVRHWPEGLFSLTGHQKRVSAAEAVSLPDFQIKGVEHRDVQEQSRSHTCCGRADAFISVTVMLGSQNAYCLEWLAQQNPLLVLFKWLVFIFSPTPIFCCAYITESLKVQCSHKGSPLYREGMTKQTWMRTGRYVLGWPHARGVPKHLLRLLLGLCFVWFLLTASFFFSVTIVMLITLENRRLDRFLCSPHLHTYYTVSLRSERRVPIAKTSDLERQVLDHSPVK